MLTDCGKEEQTTGLNNVVTGNLDWWGFGGTMEWREKR